MPAQLTAAPGAVATRKNPTAGEEQAKSRTPGETTYKHCTTSEYASCLSDHTWEPEVIWQQSTARWHAAKYLSGGFYHQSIVKWWKMTFVYRCTKAFVHMISYIHRFRLHIFRKSSAVPLPARTNAKLNYILLFCLTRTQFLLCFEAFFPVFDAATSSCVVLQQHTNARHTPACSRIHIHFSAVEKQHTE